MQTNYKSASLAEIYKFLRVKVHVLAGLGLKFRVRHVTTLEDYGVVGISEYGSGGAPVWFKALKLDAFNKETQLRGDYFFYGLLSSVEEVQFFYASCLAQSYQGISMYD